MKGLSMVFAYNSFTWVVKTEGQKFKIILGYVVS